MLFVAVLCDWSSARACSGCYAMGDTSLVALNEAVRPSSYGPVGSLQPLTPNGGGATTNHQCVYMCIYHDMPHMPWYATYAMICYICHGNTYATYAMVIRQKCDIQNKNHNFKKRVF